MSDQPRAGTAEFAKLRPREEAQIREQRVIGFAGMPFAQEEAVSFRRVGSVGKDVHHIGIQHGQYVGYAQRSAGVSGSRIMDHLQGFRPHA